MKHFAKVVLTVITSSKLWMTAAALACLRFDYWADVTVLSSLPPEQLDAFVKLAAQKNDTGKWILLGFLGITGAVQMSGGSVASNLMRRINSEPPPNRSWKSDPSQR